jgi:hypothetical protein
MRRWPPPIPRRRPCGQGQIGKAILPPVKISGTVSALLSQCEHAYRADRSAKRSAGRARIDEVLQMRGTVASRADQEFPLCVEGRWSTEDWNSPPRADSGRLPAHRDVLLRLRSMPAWGSGRYFGLAPECRLSPRLRSSRGDLRRRAVRPTEASKAPV